MDHIKHFFETIKETVNAIDLKAIDNLANQLLQLRERNGRLFLLGVGGSAANAGHAVNDFRKLCQIEAYAPTDNVSELTARTNDDGWENIFSEWLKVSKLNHADLVFVLSVGGGNKEKNVSVNLIQALEFARSQDCKIAGIVGRDGGFTHTIADATVLVPNLDVKLVTPITEAFQGIIWHALVSHPLLQIRDTKW